MLSMAMQYTLPPRSPSSSELHLCVTECLLFLLPKPVRIVTPWCRFSLLVHHLKRVQNASVFAPDIRQLFGLKIEVLYFC